MLFSTQYTIPDLLSTWPWQRVINADLENVRGDSVKWIESLGLFEPRQLAKFKRCDFDLLGALIGRLDSKDHLRILCDLMNFYFAFDEYTDVTDEQTARVITGDVMNILRGQKVPERDHIMNGPLNKMTEEFIQRTKSVIGTDPAGMDQFIKDFEDYTQSVIIEADERNKKHVRGVDDYFMLRRDTCGAKPTFSFLGLGLGLPKEVFEDERMKSLIDSAADLIAMVNDLHSYGLERSRGLDNHNVVTAIMKEHNLDIQGAFYWLSGYASRTIARFLSDKAKLPSYGPKVDAAVNLFVDRMARCVRGYDQWSYETDRYYGKDGGIKVQKTRKVTLKGEAFGMGIKVGYVTKKQLRITSMVS
ncbi:hypothetical protein CVT24_008845 [Panaeolus cyanescens]|uniref:Terpene synthase n=1 Tax=Panaeolus cyanescens TaxID=181874 RepID=A0A409VAV2_9AGAR|nr:hypothetical protein CVT24_008845 [Panaeolus cyanescens]